MVADKISGAGDGITAHLFDGKGHARPLTASELAGTPVDEIESGFLWVHLNRTEAKAISWLKKAGLDRFIVDALTADETRPRRSACRACSSRVSTSSVTRRY